MIGETPDGVPHKRPKTEEEDQEADSEEQIPNETNSDYDEEKPNPAADEKAKEAAQETE